jgi:hypothetical protein
MCQTGSRAVINGIAELLPRNLNLAEATPADG